MAEFTRIIAKVEQPLYETVLAEMTENNGGTSPVQLVAVEPGAHPDNVLVHLRYRYPMDLFMLGFKLGAAKVKGEQSNG